jgi:hypothetical protein
VDWHLFGLWMRLGQGWIFLRVLWLVCRHRALWSDDVLVSYDWFYNVLQSDSMPDIVINKLVTAITDHNISLMESDYE